ncbi:redoxin domain-containing protein [Halovenus sp. HT40]|uniref:redoxin domain-containing protein n=1 Tax=Halovenus sp. HT40 TaxID=3126691 RepID=UPI00300F4C00
MIESGEDAPSFTLPAVRDGEIETLDLNSFLGSEVVILAFYPGDFNPACSGTETGLDELDLFTMQKDVQVLAISGDSVYSHQAFADQYDLHMPLLSDTDGTVAAAYGVAVDDEQAGHLAKRAVIVVDHTETVQYTWASENPGRVPRAEEIRSAVEGIGDDETAESRYRVGYAHYMEGRRAFTSAMKAYESQEWMMAQTDFTQAGEEFDEAGEEFNTAVRFAEREETRTYFERAEQKSESLWRAADWLAESASAFASGEGAKGDSLRRDAESPLETARELHEPPEPDGFPPEEDPAEQDDEDEPIHPLADEDEPAPTLDADIDDELDDSRVDEESVTEATEQTAEAPTNDQTDQQVADAAGQPDAGDAATEQADPGSENDSEDSADTETATEIDDEELEEITAELEEQTEAAELSDPEPDDDGIPDEPGITRDDADEEETETDEEVELELTDPTEGEDEDDESLDDEKPIDDETGDHGVPDSL